MSDIKEAHLSRRDFLKTTGLVTGGLVVAFYIPTGMKKAFAAGPADAKPIVYPPNAFIHIAPDNSITLVINKLEMGQGVNTSMAQLIAEELECDWKKISSISAPVDPVYNHTQRPMQMTGGSSALKSSWEQHRKLGASLREMLKLAAAQKWGVPVSEVKAENGFVIHAKMGKLSYGELAEDANKIPLPENPPLKSAKDFKVIGKSMSRVDAPDKSNGKAIFGMDVRIPGMLYAMVSRPSVSTAKLVSYDEKAARAIPGVIDVVKFGDRVAVLARNTHIARIGRDALKAQFDSGPHSKSSTDAMMESFRKQAQEKGLIADDRGSVEKEMSQATQKIVAEYEFPFLAHAPMEPMNCTIHFDGNQADVWAGHQMPTMDRDTVVKELGLKPEQIHIHTTYAGGSFGRRANKNSDYVTEACHLAKIVKKPLKIVWSREDDMRGGFYRPMNFHRATLGFNKKNQLVSWDHHVVGQSVIGGSVFEPMMVKKGLESTVTEGVSETRYDFPHFRCQQTRMETPMTTLWWRSVGHTHTAFAMETLVDEVAEKSGIDPFQYRQNLLHKSPRHMAVLELLKKNTHWGTKKAPKGRAWGVAIHEAFDTVVGQVAEVSLEKGKPRVHRVWCVVHCGQVVNPEGAKTQVEGAIVFGLSAAFHQHIEVENGEIVQTNFHDYPVLRIQDMPEVHVDFVKTDAPPTGLGEPGLPPIAPAVANAFYQLTKKRLRRLPFSKELLA
jgi:isoquinoline 1-oxidoreductase beta subunit